MSLGGGGRGDESIFRKKKVVFRVFGGCQTVKTFQQRKEGGGGGQIPQQQFVLFFFLLNPGCVLDLLEAETELPPVERTLLSPLTLTDKHAKTKSDSFIMLLTIIRACSLPFCVLRSAVV